MTKKTIIFDTDDESKGHYPSDEAYAPLEIGKVYHVIEDVPSKSITLYPVDISSNLPSMGLGIDGLRINKSEKDVVGSLLVATGSINGNNYKTLIQEDGDIIGNRWSTDKGVEESLSNYILHNIGTAIENSVQGDLSSGWMRLQNGLLLQWGIEKGTNGEQGWITFPTVFTTYCNVTLSMRNTRGNKFMPVAFLDQDDVNNLKIQTFYCRSITDTGNVVPLNTWQVQWLAIGY